MKYKEWLSFWLENCVKPTTKRRTYEKYLQVVRLHVSGSLGEERLDELTPLKLQKYVTELLQSGNTITGKALAVNSVNGIINVIQVSLKSAYTLGETDKYVGDRIKRPRSQEKKVTCFALNEQKIIERAALADGRKKMFGVVLCLYSGLRVGELLALRWADIDFAQETLTVNKTCYDSRGENGKICRIEDLPKTVSSRRVIPLPAQILKLLKKHKKQSESEYVISIGAKPILVRSYQRSFELMLKDLKIEHRGFHSLRHTFATRALECGMDVKTLAEILGHKNPTITLSRYTHSMPDHKKEMMNRLGKML